VTFANGHPISDRSPAVHRATLPPLIGIRKESRSGLRLAALLTGVRNLIRPAAAAT
jgi:hypothetical protein